MKNVELRSLLSNLPDDMEVIVHYYSTDYDTWDYLTVSDIWPDPRTETIQIETEQT